MLRPTHTGIAATFSLTSSPSEGALFPRDIVPPSKGGQAGRKCKTEPQ